MTADTSMAGPHTPLAPSLTFEGVRAVLVEVLALDGDTRQITPETGLLGALPELDSLSVVELAAALEDRFDILIEDDDFTGEVFDTVGSLTAFVDTRRTESRGRG